MKYRTFVIVLSFIVFGSGVGLNVYAQTKKAANPSPVKKVEEKPVEIAFPDATVGRLYVFSGPRFINSTAPCKVSIVSGNLPSGLAINQKTGNIEGQPDKQGVWKIVLSVTDSKSKKEIFSGTIQVWRMLSIGEHGQFKGSNGFQMALNITQDMDEIRIEKGIIEVSGLAIPGNKEWDSGIKISGGWNETFGEKSNKPEDTVLDGGGKENRILSIFNKKDEVLIENLIFRNSSGGAVGGVATFNNCVFIKNSGGAVNGGRRFYNCTFENNSATNGGAVNSDSNVYNMFINCKFINNLAEGGSYWTGGSSGGAVYGIGYFSYCVFRNNSTIGRSIGGGAVYGNSLFNECTFENNSASTDGGAVYGYSNFKNCTFENNSATNGGAVYNDRAFVKGLVLGNGAFTNCTFTNNSAINGGAYSGNGVFINSTFYSNKAKINGGAFFGGGNIINSIFYKNTAAEKDNDITAEGDISVDYSLVNYLGGAANVGSKIIMGDPKFVDPDNGDFHLRPDSPCIGKGKDAKDLGCSPVGQVGVKRQPDKK